MSDEAPAKHVTATEIEERRRREYEENGARADEFMAAHPDYCIKSWYRKEDRDRMREALKTQHPEWAWKIPYTQEDQYE